MTTPTSPVQPINDPTGGNSQFVADFNKLYGDATTYLNLLNAHDDQQTGTGAVPTYQNALKSLWGSSLNTPGSPQYNPMEVYLLIMYILVNAGMNDLDSNQSVNAGAITIQADVTKLNNDIQNLTNSSTTTAEGGQGIVTEAASDLSLMLDMTSSKSLTANAQTWYSQVQQALGTEGTGSFFTNFQTLRSEFRVDQGTGPLQDPFAHDNSAGSYNPTKVSPPGSSRTYYFDPNDADYIQSFGGLQADLATKGNPKQASEAETTLTQTTGTITATSQSVSAAANVIITQSINLIKAVQSFLVDMMHSNASPIKAAVQNQVRS